MWNLFSDGTLMIAGTGDTWDMDGEVYYEYEGDVDVLHGIVSPGVTRIGDCAFSCSRHMTSVEISESIISLGFCAFYGCSSLTHVDIPNSVSIIEEYCFSECYSLATVRFNCNAPQINEGAFKGVTATVYYPAAASGWNAVVGQNYGGDLTWVAVTDL